MDINNLLVGQTTSKIDSKYRLFIPRTIVRNMVESFVIVYDEEMNCFKLYDKEVIKLELERLEGIYKCAVDEDAKRKAKIEYYHFCKTILREAILDQQGRVTLPSTIDPKTEVTVIGAGDHLLIQPVDNQKTKAKSK